jgi:hypothetical protein
MSSTLGAYVSIRQHTSAYVSIRQHTSAYVGIRAVINWSSILGAAQLYSGKYSSKLGAAALCALLRKRLL